MKHHNIAVAVARRLLLAAQDIYKGRIIARLDAYDKRLDAAVRLSNFMRRAYESASKQVDTVALERHRARGQANADLREMGL